MININLDKLVYEPMINLPIAIILSVIMLIIVILNKKHIVNRILIIIVFLIISQRPMILDIDKSVFNWDFDIIFVIDNTVSMNAMDVNGLSRIDAIKKDIEEIVSDFAGANFAIINYSNVAQLKYPFTRSSGKILDIVHKLKTIDPNYASGSTLDLPYDYMKMLLESSRKKEERKTMVFFMGDGEIKATNDLDKYKNIADLIDSGAVLGYGTPEGSKIKITESVNLKELVDNEGFLIDADTGSPYISKLDEDNLRIVADKLGIAYFHMTDYSALKDKITELKIDAIKNDDEKEEMEIDIYYYFSGLLVVLLLFELSYYRRNN